MTITRVSSPLAPAPGGAYSQAIAVNGFLYTSGMGPVDPATGDVVGADISGQTNQVMQNLQQLLKAESLDFSDVVKATVHTYRTSGATSLLSTMRTSRPSLTGSRSVRP